MKAITHLHVIIEGSDFEVEDRKYSGKELRSLAGLKPRDKLVREEDDGTETPIPPGREVHPREGDNFFVSVRFRRG